jgi:hypothetical protein
VLDLGLEPKSIEGMHYTLKRLVAGGLIAENEPDLFCTLQPVITSAPRHVPGV